MGDDVSSFAPRSRLKKPKAGVHSTTINKSKTINPLDACATSDILNVPNPPSPKGLEERIVF